MTPADGASLHVVAQPVAAALIEVPVAVVLPGGRCLLAIMGRGEPAPATDEAMVGDQRATWSAACWPVGAEPGAWAGVALIDSVPTRPLSLHAEHVRWILAAPARLDVSPEPVAAHARCHALPGRGVLDFLRRHLPAVDEDGRPGGAAEARRGFVAGFLHALSEPAGFVEVFGTPECGGLFAQGWSVSLDPGHAGFARLCGDPSLADVEVAAFPREDVLAPAHGVCLFGHDWAAGALGALSAVFFEQGGPLRRLDVVEGSTLRLAREDTTAHVARMLPRLAGPRGTLRAFRRFCRPRYVGADTLSGTGLPVAAALDAVFQAPDGGLLAVGWLLDPLGRVERALVKDTGGLYAPLQDRWHRLPRPDLVPGFSADPRFAHLLAPDDALHGFLAYAPGRTGPTAATEAYLELVLDDGSCLFRPLLVTPIEDRDRVLPILNVVPPADPDIDAVVRDTLAPFLAALPPRAPRSRVGRPRPILLGRPGPARVVAAIMPVGGHSELQPVLALLAGTPDAAALDLVLVASRSVAAGLSERLDDAFRFYGLKGALVLAPERDGLVGRLEAGVAASEGDRVLLWTPRALPRAPGWLGRLAAEADALDRPGLVSPTLIYEDGSVYFGPGDAGDEGAAGSSVLGYPAGWLPPGGTSPVPCGSMEVALVDRAALVRAGGLSGRLFGDALAHHDLAWRLREAGSGTWCAGSVEFWMLEDPAPCPRGPHERIMDKVDALLVAAQRVSQ